MKKTVFFTAILAFVLLAGCETKTYTVMITNSSSQSSIKYTYNDSTDTLTTSSPPKTYYDVKPYTQPPVIITPDPKTVVIKYNTTTGDYTFEDKPVITP